MGIVRVIVALACCSLFLAACSSEEPASNDRSSMERAVVTTYADIVYATYDDAVQGARALEASVTAFVAAPSATTLADARAAWIAARTPYGQTDVFRFYGGPIDDDDGPEGLLNGWPLDEAFIDYVEGDADAGIIADVERYPTITADLIALLNEVGGETNISCGYHAVEFLLWGQDRDVAGPGARPYTDYVASATGPGRHAARRGAYLLATARLIVEQLTSVRDAWAPGADYREAFTGSARASLELLLTGALRFGLGELAGERMSVALDNADQEDEHSCFSDQTHMDVILGQRGIANVMSGRYVRTDGTIVAGTGFFVLVASADAGKADAMRAAQLSATTAAESVPVPFDAALTSGPGRTSIKACIDAITAECAAIQQGIYALGLTVTI